MGQKIPVIPIILVVLMATITVGILLEEPKSGDSSFVFGSAHEHASISLIINGDKFDFTGKEFQLQSSFIHLENFDGYVIHRHSKDVTIGYLFDTLNFGLSSDCIIPPNGKKYCANSENTLKFYINEKKIDNLRDYLIFDGDFILISYGSENQDEISKQLKELRDRGFPFQIRAPNENDLSKF